MSLAQESVYRDDQDFSNTEDKTSDNSISLNQNTKDKPGIPVCKICKTEFSKSSSTLTLARHLTIHNIVALKQGKKPLNLNPHSKIEQQKRTNLVVRWIICDLQPFSIVEGEEWQSMISKFDPQYQFSTEKSLALTTDNASLMVLCGTLLKEKLQELNNNAFSHYQYAAHVLNLAVCRGIDLINKSVIK
ncbi:39806_t:CDS:2, partial [Gigaspora margarita]